MTDTQWGPPLQGEQMKMLWAAGLPEHTVISAWQGDDAVTLRLSDCSYYSSIPYSLPADHVAYKLLKAGWLDGRNVRLWNGGDKAPDDWEEYSEVLLGNGVTINTMGVSSYGWRNVIIAYIAKEDAKTRTSPDTHSDRTIGRGLPDFEQPETVTIEKLTEEGWRDVGLDVSNSAVYETLSCLGLVIKPEPTREERFWALHKPEGTTIPTHIKKWVKDALEFER